MKNFSISKKFTTITILITLFMLLIGFFVLNNNKNNLIDDLYQEIKLNLSQEVKNKIQAKLDVGISNAISIANDNMIKEALIQNNRELAIKSIGNLSKK